MSTNSIIAKKIGENQYKAIYCHSDGYLTYNGALLLDHYSNSKRIDKLLDLGNISYLAPKINPDPTKPHSFDYDKRQEGVVVAYGRDRGEKGQEAKILTLEDLQAWFCDYTYVYDETTKAWQYLSRLNPKDFHDVKTDLDAEWSKYGLERMPNYYGFLTDDIAKEFKMEAKNNEI